MIARVMNNAMGGTISAEVRRRLALAVVIPGTQVNPSDPGTIARHTMEAGHRAMSYRYAMRAGEEV